MNDKAAIEKALDALREAIGGKRVEPICAAYQLLRKAAADTDHAELIRLAERATGAPVETLIISAYSHRECFMCDKGTVACDACDGSGRGLEGTCPACLGMGLTACRFCRGTGWPDNETIPQEIRRPVLARKRLHIRRELQTLDGLLSPAASRKLRKAPAEQKAAVRAWLIRLRSRITTLMRASARKRSVAARIDKCMKVVK